MTTNTTPEGVLNAPNTAAPTFESSDDAAAAFLDRWTDDDQEKKPASEQPEVNTNEDPDPEQEEDEGKAEEADEETEETEDPEEEQEEDTEEETEESEEGEDNGDKPESKTLDDDAVVEIKVDDQALKVSVKELKRLYGQEAALTKKSQQVAQQRKEVEQESTKVSAILEKMHKKAADAWEPYSKVDMLVAAKQLDADEFAALRQAAQTAYEEYQWITQEVDTHIKETQAKQQTQLKEAAIEAVKVLKDKIPGWNQEVYGKILSYGVTMGLSEQAVNSLVDPVAIELINKARLYDEGKKVVTKKKVKMAKKVMKPNANTSEKFTSEKKVKAAQRFQRTGDVDDAAELFLSRWEE